MKLPTRVEQGQTELKGPAPAQVGCSAESRLEQKEGYGWHASIIFYKQLGKHYYTPERWSIIKMAGPKMIKIDFYMPTKTKDGRDIDPKKVDDIINLIWPRYQGATKLRGTGYYRARSGKDEVTESYLLSIITERDRPFKADLKKLKEKIRDELNQEAVLITWHFINVS